MRRITVPAWTAWTLTASRQLGLNGFGRRAARVSTTPWTNSCNALDCMVEDSGLILQASGHARAADVNKLTQVVSEPVFSRSHDDHKVHHEPSCRSAPASHSSGVAAQFGLVQ